MRADDADGVRFVNEAPALRFVERHGVFSSLQKTGFAAMFRNHESFKFPEYQGGIPSALVRWERPHLSDLEGWAFAGLSGERSKGRNGGSAGAFVVGTRAIRVRWNDMGSSDSDHLAAVLDPGMNSLRTVSYTHLRAHET